MDSLISTDGTPIAFERTGAGSPLVLVHGTSASGKRWARVLARLQSERTVFAVDRRGRGASGDGGAYAMEREFEDVAKVIASIGGPVDLLGHSFGAICALEASLRAGNIRKLVLYEPPIPVEGFPDGPASLPGSEAMRRLRERLAAGDRQGVLEIFFREINGMPAAQFEQFKTLPEWQGRLAAAHTLPREIDAVGHYRFEAQRFAGIAMPVLLMLGGESPAYFGAAIDMLAAALPRSRKVVLPGQRHVAMDTAPDLFADEVLAYLTADD